MKVLITGATSGIGNFLSKNLPGKEKIDLIIMGRDIEKGKELGDFLLKQSNYKSVEFFTHDFTEEFPIPLLKKLSKVDVIINSAADFGSTQKITDFDHDQLFVNFDVNVVKPIQLFQNSIASMVKNNFGIIINIGSTSGIRGYPLRLPYCMSKHALLAFTKTLNGEIISGVYGENLNIRAYYLVLPPVNNERLKKQISERAEYKKQDYLAVEKSFAKINNGFISEQVVMEKIISIINNRVKEEIIYF